MEPKYNNEGDNNIPEENDPGLIEQLETKLYSRKDTIIPKGRTRLHPKKWNVSEDWDEEGDSLAFKKKEKPIRSSPFAKLFLLSFFFFAVAALFAGYNIFSKRNVVSSNNLTISLFGPVSVRGGDVLTIQAIIENKNPVEVTNAIIGANFPEGSRYPNNPDKDFPRYRKALGTMAPGEVRTEELSVILLGADNTQKEIEVSSEFSLNGSNAKYTVKKTFTVNLTMSPITLRTSLLKETTSGQEVTLGLDAVSNSQSVLHNTLVKIEYPTGFEFMSAVPAPFSGNNIWDLGEMNLGDIRHIVIKGKIQGENGQEKVFRIYGGVTTQSGGTKLETTFATLLSGTTVSKPFIGMNLTVNGSSDPDYVLSDRSGLGVDLLWSNTLPDKITHGEIQITMSGEMIDKTSLKPKVGGYYDAVKNSVLWNERTTSTLASIPAGGRDSVGITASLLPHVRSNGTVFKNPVLNIDVSVKGNRVSENNVTEEINSFIQRTVKIGTQVDFSSLVYINTGPFQNTGPVPPRVGEETTYTIIWKVSNTVNDVSGAKVTATLPQAVRWVGVTSPGNANVSFNSVTGTITWNIGSIDAGAGYEDVAKEIAFQVGLTPSLSMVKTSPNLMSSAVFTGVDSFTGLDISKTSPSVSTYITSEDQSFGLGNVVP